MNFLKMIMDNKEIEDYLKELNIFPKHNFNSSDIIEKLNLEFNKNSDIDIDISNIFNDYINTLNNQIQLTNYNNENTDIILDNTLKYFGYSVSDDFKLLKNDLLILIKNDKVFNKKYSYNLFHLFEIIRNHKNLLDTHKNISSNKDLSNIEKGTAYSLNKNTDDIVIPFENDITGANKILINNTELLETAKILKMYKENSYKVITYLNCINESTISMITNDKDLKSLNTLLKIKKFLNSAQGLNSNNFINSVKQNILLLFPYNKESKNNYGFKSKQALISLLNSILEDIVKIDSFKFDIRDLNQETQILDFLNDNILLEKVTATNSKEHPIFDDPEFELYFHKILKKAFSIKTQSK